MITCAIQPGMIMVHPGLPGPWVVAVLVLLAAMALWAVCVGVPRIAPDRTINLSGVPLVGPVLKALTEDPLILRVLKGLFAAAFILVAVAGLWGSPIPERNLATTLTWSVWWTLLIAAVLMMGPVWCAVCPWHTIANWLARVRLHLSVPAPLRNVWPALALFCALTWLELGAGITASPSATAQTAIAMVVMATVALVLFERRAFCRYFCPIGRTLGFYGRLAPVTLRGDDPAACAACTTFECYHGSQGAEPCPSALTVGRMSQSTYCLSCGACAQSCPSNNVSWHLRPLGHEARTATRPHWDEAAFMLALLGLTSFHGITMMPFWEPTLRAVGRILGDSGRLPLSFSLAMAVAIVLPATVYAAAILAASRLTGIRFSRLFCGVAIIALPVAFSYHLAHNIGHFSTNAGGLGAVMANPLGIGAQPLSALDRHLRMMEPLIDQRVLWTIQAGLIVLGHGLAVQILRHQGRALLGARLARVPLVLFLAAMSGFNLWLLANDMVMPG